MLKESKILIIDDDPDICDILFIMLSEVGYDCRAVQSPEAGFEALKRESWDLIILDVMLPTMNGFDICQVIRQEHNIPILFLTSKTSTEDMAKGYASGGDDYVTKPFLKEELIHRVTATLRRYIVYQGKSDNKVLSHLQSLLTDLEDRILKYLMDNQGACCSPKAIYEHVWNEPYFETSNNTVVVHISGLRKKINQHASTTAKIRTVWGRGYQFEYIDTLT